MAFLYVVSAIALCAIHAQSLRQRADRNFRGRSESSFSPLVWVEMGAFSQGQGGPDACEWVPGSYKLPPLKTKPTAKEIRTWCDDTWPDEGANGDMDGADVLSSAVHCPSAEAMSQSMAKSFEKGTRIVIPAGEHKLNYKISKVLGGGAANVGVFILKLEPSQKIDVANAPKHVFMKLPKFDAEAEYNLQQSEVDCMRGVSGIRGTPSFYGDAFQYNDRCFKAVLSEAVDGKDLGDFMPLTREEECTLQQETGRLMCGFMRRGFVDLDFNNPGNFLVKRVPGQATQFTKIDQGVCYSQSPSNEMFKLFESIASLPPYQYWQTNEKLGLINPGLKALHLIHDPFFGLRADPPADAKVATRSDIANTFWRCDLFANSLGFYLGAGDLILNSQSRVHALNLKCENAVPGATTRMGIHIFRKCKCPWGRQLVGDAKECSSWTSRFDPAAKQGKGCRCV